MREFVELIYKELEDFRKDDKKFFLSSSLQTHSLPLVHIIHQFDKDIPIFFLDTGYHFPETIKFKDQLKDTYGFNIVELRSEVSRLNQKDSSGRLLFASDPDYCCYLNKVKPLEPVLKDYDIWISGLRKSQTSYRATMEKVIEGKFKALHYHPILDWTSKMIHQYRKEHNLPEHPLEKEGYFSIGCMPCTRKIDLNAENDLRNSRWFGLNKEECGLHTETV